MPEERTSRKGETYYVISTAELEGAAGWKYTHAGRKGRGACVMHGGDNPSAMEADFATGWVECHTRGCVGRIAEHPDTHAGRGPELTIGGHRLGRSKASSKRPAPPPKAKAKPAVTDPTTAANLLAELAGYRERLPSSPGAAYLEGRGFPVELATAYGIGWGGSMGRMAGRVVFPLADPVGRVTSATGRGIAPDADPKYYTLPADPYPKTLVNGGALQVAARERLPVYVCEGPMDALALLAGGITTAVAMLGTSGFRVEWLADVPLVVACFDDDDAGRKGRDELTFTAASMGVPVQVMPPDILQGMNDLADFWKARLALPPELVAHWDAAQFAAVAFEPEPGPNPDDDFAFTVVTDNFTGVTTGPEPQDVADDPRAADATPTQPVGGLPADDGEAAPRVLVADDWEDPDDGPAFVAELAVEREAMDRAADLRVPPDGVEQADWDAIAYGFLRARLQDDLLTSPRAAELCPSGDELRVAVAAYVAADNTVTGYAHLLEDLGNAYRNGPAWPRWRAVIVEANERRRHLMPDIPRCHACGGELVAGSTCRTCHPWNRPADVVGLELADFFDRLADAYLEGTERWWTD